MDTYFNDLFNGNDAAALATGGFLAFLIVFVLVLVAIGIVLYLLTAISLYKMAKRRNFEYSWIAFIPGVQYYIIGKILKRLNIFGLEIPRPEILLAVAPFASAMVSVPVLGWIISIAAAILIYSSFYYFFAMFKGKDTAVVYLILSIILPFMGPIFIFTLRNADEIPQNMPQQ